MKSGKKRSIKAFLRDWDAGRFDLDAAAAEPYSAAPEGESAEGTAPPEESLPRRDVKAYRAVYPLLAAMLGAIMIVFLFLAVLDLPAFGKAGNPSENEVVRRYVESGLSETGAVNIVSGVILDYRAFDTLGESHVLFTGLAAVLILLLELDGKKEEPDLGLLRMKADSILGTAARLLIPVIVLFGIYVILNGHLGPGGGFSGGAIIGAGLILYAEAFGYEGLERFLNFRSFRIICLAALWFYSMSKCYSFFCGANGLHTVFTTGTPGRILSAGLILPLNIAVGVVVACTMYGLYSLFQRGRI